MAENINDTLAMLMHVGSDDYDEERGETMLEIDIALWELAVAFGAVLVAAAVSMFFNLGLHTQLMAMASTFYKLKTVLGFILVPVIEYGHWWIVLLVSATMLTISGIEAVSRPSFTYKGMLIHMLISICMGVGAMLLLAFPALIRVRPLLSGQVFIPVLGTLLDAAVTGASAGLTRLLQDVGSGTLLDAAVTGASAGLTRLLQDVGSGHSYVELLLAHGASRWEATQWLVSDALSVSMAPVLTHLGVVGLVTIPGVMSGMILQGASPVQASRLQACLVLLVVGTTVLSSLACVMLAMNQLVDHEHIIRMDRLRKRAHEAGIGLYVRSKLVRAAVFLRRVALRVAISCCGVRLQHGTGRATGFWLRLVPGAADAGRAVVSRYRLNSLGQGSEDSFDDFLSWDGTESGSVEGSSDPQFGRPSGGGPL
eukprot:gene13720-19616_t